MNEKIKELIKEAGMDLKSDVSTFGMDESINAYHCQGFMLEKFAELIIKTIINESVRLKTEESNVMSYMVEKGYRCGYQDGLDNLISQIKRTF